MTADGPAANAGVKVGDILKEIDGVDVFRRPVKEFGHIISSGASGSIVELTMIKKANDETYKARVTRVNSSSIALPPIPAAPGSPGMSPEKEMHNASPQKQLESVVPLASGSPGPTVAYDPSKGIVGFSVLKNPEDARWEIDQIIPGTPAASEPRLIKGAVIM